MPALEDALLWSLNQRIAQYAFISWNNAIDKSLWYLGFSLGLRFTWLPKYVRKM